MAPDRTILHLVKKIPDPSISQELWRAHYNKASATPLPTVNKNVLTTPRY